MGVRMTEDYELSDRAREILREMEPVIPRSDVTIHADEALSEDLQKALQTVLGAHPELWFIEARRETPGGTSTRQASLRKMLKWASFATFQSAQG